uniref:Uncharacterized protein n=1 Tax=Vespula pensylvanica TaxID=30213 RepID=A0A834PGX8_VESPE|nr:hypothetical protein H0235_001751 [Vespula pensylvanica]
MNIPLYFYPSIGSTKSLSTLFSSFQLELSNGYGYRNKVNFLRTSGNSNRSLRELGVVQAENKRARHETLYTSWNQILQAELRLHTDTRAAIDATLRGWEEGEARGPTPIQENICVVCD